jgi:hypothetical protein
VNEQRLTVDVEPTYTIRNVKEKVQQQNGTSPHMQRLIYSGKELIDSKTLEYYNIREESTLHLILRLGEPKGASTVPTESVFPNRASADESIRAWKTKAEQGDFDDDIYIVDPQAHYSRLDSLEKDVVEASEFFRCRGAYDPLANGTPENFSYSGLMQLIPDWMWPFHEAMSKSVSQDLNDDFQTDWQLRQQALASLWKSYLIMCRVLASFDRLSAANFCTSSYNLLVKHDDNAVAEIVKIPRAFLDDMKIGIETATVQIRDSGTTPEIIHVTLQECIELPCSQLLDILHLPTIGETPRPSAAILDLCRMTSILADLALVSYVGSHGVRFDRDYLKSELSSIVVQGRNGGSLNFDCTVRQLACLDGFLDHEKAWVFQCSVATRTDPSPQSKECPPLFILTRMEDFADIWGPVWPISVGEQSPELIKQYNVSKGVICRISDGVDWSIKNAVRCHWYNWPSFQRRRASTLLSRVKPLYLKKDDLLLIGTRLRENRYCSYSLNDFERDYGHEMGVLGSEDSRWEPDSRSVGLSFSHIIGIAVQGTVKKRPQTSLKQLIIDKWTNNPRRANPGVLNQLLGVEISHCTGNARRVRIKDLILMDTVRSVLERQYPGWSTSTWGAAFLGALKSTDDDAVFDVWQRHYDKRPDMADLVCGVLELLDKTGRGRNGFTAGFLNNQRERCVIFDYRRNDWSCILQDSPLTAVYAVINGKCFECHTPDHSTSTCGRKIAYTVLETQLGVENSGLIDRVKVKPHGQVLEVLNSVEDPSSRALLMTPASTIRTYLLLVPLVNASVSAVEVRDPAARGRWKYNVFLRASNTSHNGMIIPRELAELPQPIWQPTSRDSLTNHTPNSQPTDGDRRQTSHLPLWSANPAHEPSSTLGTRPRRFPEIR